MRARERDLLAGPPRPLADDPWASTSRRHRADGPGRERRRHRHRLRRWRGGHARRHRGPAARGSPSWPWPRRPHPHDQGQGRRAAPRTDRQGRPRAAPAGRAPRARSSTRAAGGAAAASRSRPPSPACSPSQLVRRRRGRRRHRSSTSSWSSCWPRPPPRPGRSQHPERAGAAHRAARCEPWPGSGRCACSSRGLIGADQRHPARQGPEEGPVRRRRRSCSPWPRRPPRHDGHRGRGARPHRADHRVRRHRRPRGDGAPHRHGHACRRHDSGSPTSWRSCCSTAQPHPGLRRGRRRRSIGLVYAKDLMRAERDGAGARAGHRARAPAPSSCPRPSGSPSCCAEMQAAAVPHGHRGRRVRRHRRAGHPRGPDRGAGRRDRRRVRREEPMVEPLPDGDVPRQRPHHHRRRQRPARPRAPRGRLGHARRAGVRPARPRAGRGRAGRVRRRAPAWSNGCRAGASSGSASNPPRCRVRRPPSATARRPDAMPTPRRRRRGAPGEVGVRDARRAGPTSGKSTLLNQILGTKVADHLRQAPDHPHPDPRRAAPGRRAPRSSFVDTPGIHKPRTLLGERLNDTATEAARRRRRRLPASSTPPPPIGPGDRFVAERGARRRHRGGQQDRPGHRRDEVLDQLAGGRSCGVAEYFPVSAHTGEGVAALVEHLVAALPEGPRWYPDGHGHRRAPRRSGSPSWSASSCSPSPTTSCPTRSPPGSPSGSGPGSGSRSSSSATRRRAS